MGETEESIRKIVNSSGFPFQLWIHDQIRRTSSEHGWKVIGLEFRWFDERTQREEFVDILLKNESNTVRAIIEAKRVRGGTWIFLQPSSLDRSTRRFRYLWIYPPGEKIGWHEGYFGSEFDMSSFCVVRSQAQNQPMLERVTSYVLAATESIGKQELLIQGNHPCIYLPIIVTTAKLVTHTFDPAEVDPSTGVIKESIIEEVPYIVFRKSFGTTYQTTKKFSDLAELNNEDERTVLVVNSLHLKELLIHLNAFKLTNRYESFPWE